MRAVAWGPVGFCRLWLPRSNVIESFAWGGAPQVKLTDLTVKVSLNQRLVLTESTAYHEPASAHDGRSSRNHMPATPITDSEVRWQLSLLLEGKAFRSSPVLSRFLRFVVDAALSAGDLSLKEYEIGREVFDRDPSFDPRLDSIVRVQARRLRAKLSEHYGGQGQNDPIVIELRKGGYRPSFSRAPDRPLAKLLVPSESDPAADRRAASASPPNDNTLLDAGERTQATIVISVLHGLSDLFSSEDPGAVREWILDLEARIDRVAAKDGGVASREDSDKFVVIFGVDSVYEDDAERAARSALDIHEAVRIAAIEAGFDASQEVRLASGIASGVVAVLPPEPGRVGRQLHGAPRRTASTLALLAGPDEVLAPADFAGRLSSAFEVQARAPIEFQSTEERIIPHVVRRRGNSGENRGPKLSLTPHVGRAEELQTLHRLLERSCQGEGQCASVVGEPGLGKSRLLREFESQIVNRRVAVLHGHCYPDATVRALSPFVQALEQLAGPIDEQARSSTERVRESIRSIHPDLEPSVPLLLALLSVDDASRPNPRYESVERLRQSVLNALSSAFTLFSLSIPTVLLLEDWHWADAVSQEALHNLVEMTADYPLLVVTTARPGLPLDLSRLHYSAIRLKPLDSRGSREVTRSVLGVKRVPKELAAALHERTGGNPLFLEAFCRSLLEDGTFVANDGRTTTSGSLEKMKLPPTVSAVIHGRIGRLAPGVRRVVRIASVFGREFASEALRDAVGRDFELSPILDDLLKAALIRRARVLPDERFRFSHSLVQEVVYSTLLERQRRALHGVVGAILESRAQGRHPDAAAELARHFGIAGEWLRAAEYALRAARRSQQLCLLPETLECLKQVHQYVEYAPAQESRTTVSAEALLLEERICESLGKPRDQEEAIERLFALLNRDQPSRALVQAYIRRGDFCVSQNRYSESESSLEEALRLSRQLSAVDLEARVLRSIAHRHARLEEFHESRSVLERLLEVDRERGNTRGLILDVMSLAAVLNGLGEFESALEQARSVFLTPEAEQVRDLWIQLHYTLGEIHRRLGNDSEALSYFQRNLDLGSRELKEWGFAKPAVTMTAISNVHLSQGRLDDSLRAAIDAVEFSERSKNAEERASSQCQLGSVQLALGRQEAALASFREAASILDQSGESCRAAQMYRATARILERAGRDDDASKAWSKARKASRLARDPLGEAAALEGLGALLRRAGSGRRAAPLYRAAAGLAGKLGDSRKLADLQNTLSILAWEAQDFESALQGFRAALTICRSIGDRTHEGLMLNSVAATLRRLGRVDEAVDLLKGALTSHLRNGEQMLAGHALASLGDCYLDGREFDGAESCFQQSLRIRRELGDRRGEGWMLHRLASAYRKRGDKEAAAAMFSKAADLGEEHSIGDLSLVCSQEPEVI